MRAKGLGADVIVTEINPTRALEAVMDGFRVMPMAEAAKIGDIFVTVTGDKSVMAARAFRAHEGRRGDVQLRPLQRGDRYPGAGEAVQRQEAARPFVEEYTMKDGRKIYLLGEGRLINLAAAEGHPAVGDGYELRQPGALGRVHGEERRQARDAGLPVPEHIDQQIARLKLESMGVQIDKLTPEQEQYLASWSEGT